MLVICTCLVDKFLCFLRGEAFDEGAERVGVSFALGSLWDWGGYDRVGVDVDRDLDEVAKFDDLFAVLDLSSVGLIS